MLLNKYKNNPVNTTTQKTVSRTWRNIEDGWKDIAGVTKWVLHKGTKINFFNDNWLPLFKPIRRVIQGLMYRGEKLLKTANMWKNLSWGVNSLSFVLPP